MIVNEQAFWLIVGLFYLSKQIRFLSRDGAYLFVTLTGRLRVVLPSAPFETARGLLMIVNPFAPFRVVVRGRWGTLPLNSPSELERDWSMLIGLTRKLAGIRIIASLALLVLFLLGPILTGHYGLGRALLAIAPLWMVIYGTAACYVAFGALPAVGIKASRGMILFECLVCPGYVPALPAILAHDMHVSVDVCQFAKRYQLPADWTRLEGTIDQRIACEVHDDPSRDAELNRYRASVLQ